MYNKNVYVVFKLVLVYNFSNRLVSFSFTIALIVIIININNTVTDKNRLI